MSHNRSPDWLCAYCTQPLYDNYKIVTIENEIRRACEVCNKPLIQTEGDNGDVVQEIPGSI